MAGIRCGGLPRHSKRIFNSVQVVSARSAAPFVSVNEPAVCCCGLFRDHTGRWPLPRSSLDEPRDNSSLNCRKGFSVMAETPSARLRACSTRAAHLPVFSSTRNIHVRQLTAHPAGHSVFFEETHFPCREYLRLWKPVARHENKLSMTGEVRSRSARPPGGEIAQECMLRPCSQHPLLACATVSQTSIVFG